MNERYLVEHQTRDRVPSDYENLLGDSIEQAYAAGVHDLPGLCAALNDGRTPSPNGMLWTPDLFEQEMKRLGA